MRIYEGIGPHRGKCLFGDSDARALMYEQIGIEPIRGWEQIDREFLRQFDRDMLDWWYSGPWIVYPSEEAYWAGQKRRRRCSLLLFCTFLRPSAWQRSQML